YFFFKKKVIKKNIPRLVASSLSGRGGIKPAKAHIQRLCRLFYSLNGKGEELACKKKHLNMNNK
ncbi:hypothetical protein ACT4R9_11765, partial [Ornithobacterium rhinotracheale]|uniref:hypothetical protein n=1 Tax=Ornithobacterium rhinotracheale TaxID=28251 RepID=UPI003FD37F55